MKLATKCFQLMVCDYATRYTETVALKNIDVETIAEELVAIFSHVEIPQEILTDQGTNFTSHHLTALQDVSDFTNLDHSMPSSN